MDPIDAAKLTMALLVVKDLIMVGCLLYVWYRVRRLEHDVNEAMEEKDMIFGSILAKVLSLTKKDGTPPASPKEINDLLAAKQASQQLVLVDPRDVKGSPLGD